MPALFKGLLEDLIFLPAGCWYAELDKNSIHPESAQDDMQTRKRLNIVFRLGALGGCMRNWNRGV